MDQGGRHEDKIGRHVQVEFPHLLEIGAVLFCDFDYGDVRDFDFALLNEVQEEIERAFEDGQVVSRGISGQRLGSAGTRVLFEFLHHTLRTAV